MCEATLNKNTKENDDSKERNMTSESSFSIHDEITKLNDEISRALNDDEDDDDNYNIKPQKTTIEKEKDEYSNMEFIVLVIVLFVFFGVHNILQEAMMRLPGFKHSVMLGYMEVLGVCVYSFIERNCIRKEKGRTASLKSYPLLSLCLMTSTALSNMSLAYISYPTKIIFRSCKLIPTMVFATFINKQKFSSTEYLCALAICAGLVVFTSASWKLSPTFNPFGLILVTISVFGDSLLPNLQENLFSSGASRLEVTVYTNFFTLIAMTCTTYISGDLIGIIKHASEDYHLAVYMTIYICISYVAISSFMTVIKRYGAVTGALIGTARKAMTLMLSFLLFPKKFSWQYLIGIILVLGGLLISSLVKHKRKLEVKKHECLLGDVEMQPLVFIKDGIDKS